MKTVRFGTFETNSSSCHCVTICGENMLNKWLNKEVLCTFDFDIDSDVGHASNVVPDKYFITFEKAFNELKAAYEKGENRHQEDMRILFEDYELTPEKLKACLLGEEDIGEFDSWDLSNIMEDIYPRIWVDDGNECCPFYDENEEEKIDTSGIEGPVKTITCEVCC